MELFSKKDEGSYQPSGKPLFPVMQPLYINIPFMFDNWADPVVYLLLL